MIWWRACALQIIISCPANLRWPKFIFLLCSFEIPRRFDPRGEARVFGKDRAQDNAERLYRRNERIASHRAPPSIRGRARDHLDYVSRVRRIACRERGPRVHHFSAQFKARSALVGCNDFIGHGVRQRGFGHCVLIATLGGPIPESRAKSREARLRGRTWDRSSAGISRSFDR